MWTALEPALLTILKQEAMKLVVKNLIKGSGGLQAWIVQVTAEYLYDEVADPLVRAAIVEGKYQVHIYQGKVFVRALKEADENNDREATDIVIDGIND